MLHNERCPACKNIIHQMLEKIFGRVEYEHRIQIGTLPEDYSGKSFYQTLLNIYTDLEKYRNNKDFVKVQNLIVDCYIPSMTLVVELDESQHFTSPRKIALEHYPKAKKIGYSKEKWISLCSRLDKHDNDPPFRDEQRAWYDTLKDFLPEIKGFQPTKRLYLHDTIWCEMDPKNPNDVKRFSNLLGLDSEFDVFEKIDRFEKISQEVKIEYLQWAKDKTNYGIGAPENNSITGEFLKEHSEKIKELSHCLHEIRQKLHSIEDIAQKYRIIREIYCIQTSFHELWFYNRHYNLFYEPGLGALYHRFWGLRYLPELIQKGALDSRVKGTSTVLFSWVVLLENLYSGVSNSTLFDFRSVNDETLIKNIQLLQRNKNPTPQEVISDLPLIFEIMQTLLERTSYHPFDPETVLNDDKILFYSPCALNEGPIFIKKSEIPRIEIFKKITSFDQVVIRKILSEHFEFPSPDPYRGLPDILNKEKEAQIKLRETPLQERKYTIVNPLFETLFGELRGIFQGPVIDQKTKVTFRGKNTIGYPDKEELDIFSIFKSGKKDLKIRVYHFSMAGLFNLDAKELIPIFPDNFIEKKDRIGNHPGNMFIEGYFRSNQEINTFIQGLKRIREDMK